MGAKDARFKNAFSYVEDTLKFSDKLFMAFHGPINIVSTPLVMATVVLVIKFNLFITYRRFLDFP